MQDAGPVNMNAFTPLTSGGAVYYTAPQSMPQHTPGFQQPTQSPVYTPVQPVPADTFDPSSSSSKHVTLEDLAAIFSMNGKDPLPEWKLTQFNGDPLVWHGWLGQFRSVVDSAHLTNDMKLTYLKTLITGKTKAAISEFAYCGDLYPDALKNLERKFGQSSHHQNA